MKKSILIAFTAAITACTNQPVPTAQSVPLKLEVGIRGTESTRATGIVSNSTDSEAKVNSLQVFVFNAGSLDGYAKTENSLTATVGCSSGTREIWAIVNAPDLSGITSRSGLVNGISMLSSNTLTNFVMTGSKTEQLQFDGTVQLSVNRLASRVVLKSVKNDLSNATQAGSFVFKGAYLTNVAADVDYGLSSSYVPSNWMNRQGYEPDNSLDSLTGDSVDCAVAGGAVYDTAHYFYAYPNSSDPLVGGDWSPRRTKLVVKVEIAGDIFTYPLLLPSLEANKSYEIELLTLTRPGNSEGSDDDEEKPVNGISQGFSVTVNDWTTVPVTEGLTI